MVSRLVRIKNIIEEGLTCYLTFHSVFSYLRYERMIRNWTQFESSSFSKVDF